MDTDFSLLCIIFTHMALLKDFKILLNTAVWNYNNRNQINYKQINIEIIEKIKDETKFSSFWYEISKNFLNL